MGVEIRVGLIGAQEGDLVRCDFVGVKVEERIDESLPVAHQPLGVGPSQNVPLQQYHEGADYHEYGRWRL